MATAAHSLLTKSQPPTSDMVNLGISWGFNGDQMRMYAWGNVIMGLLSLSLQCVYIHIYIYTYVCTHIYIGVQTYLPAYAWLNKQNSRIQLGSAYWDVLLSRHGTSSFNSFLNEHPNPSTLSHVHDLKIAKGCSAKGKNHLSSRGESCKCFASIPNRNHQVSNGRWV
jgi:hypothetical protein